MQCVLYIPLASFPDLLPTLGCGFWLILEAGSGGDGAGLLKGLIEVVNEVAGPPLPYVDMKLPKGEWACVGDVQYF